MDWRNVWVFAAGFWGVAGALGSQWISARAALKMKHFELLFDTKRRAYERFFIAAAAFTGDTWGRYEKLYEALEVARLHGSVTVQHALGSDDGGVTAVAREIRNLGVSVNVHVPGFRKMWDTAIADASEAMRQDLETVRGGGRARWLREPLGKLFTFHQS